MRQVKYEAGEGWEEIDKIGVPLSKGDRIDLKWPDGSVTNHTVDVVKGWEEVYDHGNRYEYAVHEAFITICHRKSVIRISMRSLPRGVKVESFCPKAKASVKKRSSRKKIAVKK